MNCTDKKENPLPGNEFQKGTKQMLNRKKFMVIFVGKLLNPVRLGSVGFLAGDPTNSGLHLGDLSPLSASAAGGKHN